MTRPSAPRPSLRVEPLETRDTPAALWGESFDAVKVPWLPAGWRQWASGGADYFAVMPAAAAPSGANALALYGSTSVASRLWNPTPLPADAGVQGKVRGDTPAPVAVLARGQSLDTAKPSYLAAVVGPGGRVELQEVTAGVVKSLGRVTAAASGAAWLEVSVQPAGASATVRVRRTDTGQYLGAGGQWQAAAADAIAAAVAPALAGGVAGVGRLPGAYGTAYLDDFTAIAPEAPPAPTPPQAVPPAPGPVGSIPRKYSHIRIAQLAYVSNPMGEFERNLLRTSVDLVIPNAKHFDAVDTASPATPQALYSNASNLYQELLTGWLNHADAAGVSRELAFYHVPQGTPWQGNSPSSKPVAWFWDVRRDGAAGTTDLTSASQGGRTFGVAFGGAGEAVSVGYPERFRELNVALKQAAKGGWDAAWEYPTAVDAAGNPTAWAPLPLLADGTGRLRQDGRITFDPPADWVTARLTAGADRLFYVRARTVAGTAAEAPEAKTLLGRDYAGANGGRSGTIPAFDYTADRDGDGYLNDAEYAARRAGQDARFVYESRLFYPYYGQMRYVSNPSAPAFQAWAAAYHVKLLAANPKADGLFLDNAHGKLPFAGTPVIESTASYTADYAAATAAVRRAVAPKLVVSNTVGSRAEANPVAAVSDVALEEFLLRPTEANWSGLNDAADLVNQRLKSADPSPYLILDSVPGRGWATTDPRVQVGTLAYYYLLADPDKTFLMFFGGDNPSAPWQNVWSPAAAVDVGRPTGAMTVFASGADPQNAALQYRVYGRTYDNALVLYKPRSYARAVATGTTDDATATAHDLGGSYRAVNADGTLGPVVTRVSLRNGEGAVLVKADAVGEPVLPPAPVPVPPAPPPPAPPPVTAPVPSPPATTVRVTGDHRTRIVRP